jgi:Tetratricopeptide repeat
LLLPGHYTASPTQTNVQTDRPSHFLEYYLFQILFDDSDEFISIPDIHCSTLRERDIPKPMQVKPDPRRSPPDAPSERSESADKFKVLRRPGIPPGFPRRKDKLNKRNKDKHFVTRQDYERIFRLYPTNPVGYYLGMGNLLWYEERYEEARQAYLNAVLRDSNNVNAYNGLGNTFWCLEQYGEALKAYEKATQLREQRSIG